MNTRLSNMHTTTLVLASCMHTGCVWDGGGIPEADYIIIIIILLLYELDSMHS